MARPARIACALWMACQFVAPVRADDSNLLTAVLNGFYVGGELMLGNKAVQQELKVTDDQATKLDPLIQDFNAKLREENRRIRELPTEKLIAKFRLFYGSLAPELHKNVASILKPEQIKRFAEIQRQSMGTGVFLRPDVQALLKLTEAQKTKLERIHQDMADKINQRAIGGADRDEFARQTAELRKRADEEARALLTDSQKTTWTELKGKPFEFKDEPPSR